MEQSAEPEPGGGVGYRLAAQIDAHETVQAGPVVQRLLAGQIGQVEPVLDEVNAQHALQANGWVAVALLYSGTSRSAWLKTKVSNSSVMAYISPCLGEIFH